MYNWDLAIFRWLNSGVGINSFYDWAIVFRAEYLPWVVGIGIFLFLVFGRDKKLELKMILQAFLGAVLARFIFTETIRYFYDRPRPFEVVEGIKTLLEHSSDGSFPSGHAALFFAIAMGVYYYHRIWGVVFFLVALSISMGRVAAGLHWPSDILGGAAVGVISTWALAFLIKKFQYK